jgi:hypothetical protein
MVEGEELGAIARRVFDSRTLLHGYSIASHLGP